MDQAKLINKPVSLILPLYNEAGNIKSTVSSALSFLSDKMNIFEIILVNDGSTDGTHDAVIGLCNHNGHISAIHHPANRGYGAALVSGFEKAQYETVAFMGSDGQFEISEIGKLLSFTGDYDIVAGYRAKRQDPWYRVVLGSVYTRLISLLFGVSLKDINCGFKVLKKSMLERIGILSTGALVDAEILIKAKKMGYSVKEVGVTHFPRLKGRQTGASLRVILKGISELWGLWLEMRLAKKDR